ncbi:MAG: SCP2 sterol-binding domain-containing protein [Ferroplasma sp.]
MKEVLNELVKKMNGKIESDQAYAKKLQNVSKSIEIIFDDKDSYYFKVENGKITEPQEGKIDADITVTVSSEVFNKILSKEINAMDAYMKQQIKIKSSLMDKLLLSDLLKA